MVASGEKSQHRGIRAGTLALMERCPPLPGMDNALGLPSVRLGDGLPMSTSPPSYIPSLTGQTPLDTVELTRRRFARMEWQERRDAADYSFRIKQLQHAEETGRAFPYNPLRYSKCGQRARMLCLGCGDEAEVLQLCHNYRICPTCARVRSRALAKELGADAGKVEALDRERVERVRPLVDAAQRGITALMGLLAGYRPGVRGELVRIKTALGDGLDALLGDLCGEALRRDIDPRPAIAYLKAVKSGLRCRGLGRAGLGATLADASRALGNTLDYRWRLLTWTLKTDGRYTLAARKIIADSARLERSILSAPGTALVRAVEFAPTNGNLHAHGLYYGPFLPETELSAKWMALTGSYVVDVEEVETRKGGLSGAVEEVSKYMTDFSKVDPAKLLEYVEAMRGHRMVERYGLFRKVREKKPKKDPIGMVQQVDGGWDLLYDVPRCPGCGSAEVVVVELIPPGDLQTGRAGPGGAEDAGTG